MEEENSNENSGTKVGTSTTTGILICYGDSANPIGAVQDINFLRVKGGGTATIERIIFDGITLEDMFGTPDEPNGKTLWIQDNGTGVHFMFEETDVESVTTYCSTESFAIHEVMILKTSKPVKRIKVIPED